MLKSAFPQAFPALAHVLVTGKLGSCAAAKAEIAPGVERRRHKGLNNRVAIVRMRGHEKTRDYAECRTKEGKSRREIVRCIKWYIVREICRHLCVPQERVGTN
ncbi:hypothetical protein [Mangrovicoccus ximenensis]|uniref:hypothetical protein n=1 Tax=Mangrovicoccus ximenensis TaxID=1911570 RepID=UPI0011AE5F07|nr:hypothetical protein [Mangrovicoccus ximenensis]